MTNIGLTPVEPLHQRIVAPNAVHRPAGVAPGHGERIGASNAWRRLEARQVLVMFQIKRMVQIKLNAPGLRRIGLFAVDMMGEGNERLAFFQIARIADRKRAEAQTVVAGKAGFLLFFPSSHGRGCSTAPKWRRRPHLRHLRQNGRPWSYPDRGSPAGSLCPDGFPSDRAPGPWPALPYAWRAW